MLSSFFNPDNTVWSFISKIVDLVVLSLLFTLCCLPIITIGPSCTALYYAVVKNIRRRRGYATKEFFSAFRSNFKQGIIIHLILLVALFIMFSTDVPLLLTFINTGKPGDTILVILFVLKAVGLLGMICWIYPLLSRFNQSVLKLLESALVLLVHHLPATIFCIVILLLTIWLIVAEPLLLAILPGLAGLLLSLPIEPVLRKLCDTTEIDAMTTDTWYLEK